MKRSLSANIIAALISVLILVMGGSGLFSYLRERRALSVTFEDENVRSLERLSFVLRDPLWFLDLETVEKLVLFEMAERNVRSIIVLADDGSVLLARENREEAAVDRGAEPPDPARIADGTFLARDLEKDGQKVGSVVLEPSDAYIRDTLRRDLIFIIGELFALSITLILVIFFSLERMVLGKIRRVFRFITRLSEGDLTGTLSIGTGNEIGRLGEHLTGFVLSLRGLLANLKEISTGNTRSHEKVAGSMTELVDALSGIDTMMEDIRSKTEHLTGEIGGSSSAVQEIEQQLFVLNDRFDRQHGSIDASAVKVREMIRSIDALSSVTSERIAFLERLTGKTARGGREMVRTRDAIGGIAASVDSIRGILGVIEDVAQRSNLLAMNAAIEAAHAGQAGKGFAVVAGEIRKLSIATGDHARQIARTVEGIVGQIEETRGITAEAEEVIRDILSDIEETTGSIRQILGTVKEMAAGNEGTSASLDHVVAMSGELSAATSAIAARSEEIGQAMRNVNDLSEENLRSIGVVTRNVSAASASMEGLQEIGSAAVETVKVIDRELERFKTGEEA